MRKAVRTVLAVAVMVSLVGGTALAAGGNAEGKNLLKMKSGPCTFKLLEADGVTPLARSTLSLVSVAQGKTLVKALSDKAGVCVTEIAPGRYILNVNQKSLAVLETSEEATIKECRIIVPEKPMIVGGAAEAAEEEEARKGLVAWLLGGEGAAQPLIVGGVAVLAGAGGYLA